MYDCHYDLLTHIYIKRNNLREVKKYCRKIFRNNITGGIFNLFYMSLKEMKEELKIEQEEISIKENLKKIEDIDDIYDLGVRSVNIVWNNDNKFGGGAKGNKSKGLTALGEKLVKKLVDKKIAIDLSHANEKTFYDIVDLCNEIKMKGEQPIVFASHSNTRKKCDVPRNLTDDQILKIKELKSFCVKEKKFNNNKNEYYNAYVEHIKYVKELLGGVDNIAVSSDDMTYYGTKYYKSFNVFKQENMRYKLETLLWNNDFSREEIEKILYRNFKNKILNRM